MRWKSRRCHLITCVFALGLATLTGCGIRVQQTNAVFDQVAGRGPLLVVADDGSLPSNRFLQEHVERSISLKHLIREQGAPEAISLERDFLQPMKLRLLYPERGQVFILNRHEDQWFVVGSEEISESDTESLAKQRAKRSQTVAELGVRPPTHAMPPELKPVAHVNSDDFRGQLKPPGKAETAQLTRTKKGDYIHHVTFVGEDLATIADWYTESAANARRLAQTSGRQVGRLLRKGDRVVIPRSLMANPEPLPEAFVP